MPIRLKKSEEELYNILQKNSLEAVQELSKAIWTDYNEHDPGVTILDLLNYVLWELNYQLSFNFEDYLNTLVSHFNPEEHGLFKPLDVFPVSSVTLDDYRELFFDAIGDIEDVQINCHTPLPNEACTCKGLYDIKIQLEIWNDTPNRRNQVRKEIEDIYYRNRNLCESLNKIEFVDWQQLDMQASLEVDPSADAVALLAAIYIEGRKLLSQGMHYTPFDAREQPDVLFDGPDLSYSSIDKDSLEITRSTSFMSKLYKQIKNIPGIKTIYSLELTPEEKVKEPYVTVRFPKKPKEVKIVLKKEKKEINVDFEEVARLLFQYQVSLKGGHHRLSDDDMYFQPPSGKYRTIYEYYSVQHDFPNCYGINKWGVAPHESDRRKAQASQLKGYMLLFDLLFAKGLKELEELPKWMSLNNIFPPDENPTLNTDPVLKWEQLVDEDVRKKNEVTRNHTLLAEKIRWLDMLDQLYGEDSNPSLLTNFNYYNDTLEHTVYRRISFLKRIPEWGRDRFKGIAIYNAFSDGRSGIEKYLHALLGFAGMSGHPISNLYASYNLRVLNDATFFERLGWLMDYRLIISTFETLQENLLKKINTVYQSWSDKDYVWLREQIPFLRQGFIFETILQEGFKNENYRQLFLPASNFYLLMFYYEKKQEWISLGRFESEEQLTKVTTVLHSFLFMLNKKSETFYVVEHVLLRPVETKPEDDDDDDNARNKYESANLEKASFSTSNALPLDFAMSVVFVGGSVRLSDLLFRKQMERMVWNRLPIHLDVTILWLRPEETSLFEQLYYAWREALVTSNTKRINNASAKLTAYLVELNKRKNDHNS